LASSNLPIPRWYALQLDFLLSKVLARSGRVVASWRVLEAAAPELRKSVSGPLDSLRLLVALGPQAEYVGEHELANGFLRELPALRSELGQAKSPHAAGDYFAIAENLMMWGKTKEAETVLSEAPQFGEMKGEGASATRHTVFLSLGRARVRLAAGKATDALQILRDNAPTSLDPPNDWTEYRATLGEALCATGQHREGIDQLQQAVTADEPINYAHAPWLGRRRALIGLCAAGMGDRRLALRYAAQAREDFVAQPEVSPYFRAPLVKLESALGLQLPPV
jgi:tetratricopeptide (TPR) repeat protein